MANRPVPSRSPRPDLPNRVLDAGFTPGVRDVEALLDMLADDADCGNVERAIARVGVPALARVLARLESAVPPARSLLVRLLGRLVGQGCTDGVPALIAALGDDDAKVRRNAVIALGRVRGQEVERALLALWDRDSHAEIRRSLAAALGKIGTEESLPQLRDALVARDPELVRIAQRAAIMVERTTSRVHRGGIDAARAPSQPVEVHAFARHGLEELLADELSVQGALSELRVLGPGCVAGRLRNPPNVLFAARTMLGFRFALPSEWVRDGDTVSEAIGRILSSEAAKTVFEAWTVGRVRYRLAWAGAGHKRGATWEAVGAIARRAPDLINDPTQSTWEFIVSQHQRRIDLAISPRALRDPRFGWRVADVPAASHPTVAAALARVAGVRADDVVWDPFVGSGAELVERALLGPSLRLIGTDLDPLALVAARKNLAAAGVEALLDAGDCLATAPEGVTLIITNPPMGRRSIRSSGLRETLSRFMAHASAVLRPAGRLVWMAPWPADARAQGARHGLRLESAQAVDLGGIHVELQRWVR